MAEPSRIPLDRLPTPCLLLDEARLHANVAGMRAHLEGLGVTLRPHLKTAKSLDVARIAMASPSGPATVSTLLEAEYFAAGGVRDMIYAVGIAPAKLPRVAAIRAGGADLAVILDSLEQADAVAEHARASGDAVPVLIE
ncbi:alanine racemase, partial [Methylobacterium frigidaeris]